MEQQLTHLTPKGEVTMVDVGAKPATTRKALAEAYVQLAPNTLKLLQTAALPKGDALACARLGGIMAAKETSRLIPLCHNIALSFVDVRFSIEEESSRIRIETEARATDPTGVEMEAIVAAQMAAAVIYDMCKAVQRDIVISSVRLLHKSGGKSGTFNAQGYTPC